MSFPPNYLNSPPSVRFTSEMWHPNVYGKKVSISISYPLGEDPNGYEHCTAVHTVFFSVVSKSFFQCAKHSREKWTLRWCFEKSRTSLRVFKIGSREGFSHDCLEKKKQNSILLVLKMPDQVFKMCKKPLKNQEQVPWSRWRIWWCVCRPWSPDCT